MSYRRMNRMRQTLRDRILECIAESGTQQLPEALQGFLPKMPVIDRQPAQSFLEWANANNVTLLPATIQVRWHEFKKKLSPLPDKEAAQIWQAFDSDTPPETLLDLALHKDSDFRAYIAVNVNTPANVLKLLAIDEDEQVRWRVAAHQNATPEILAGLAKDNDSAVRTEVAKNVLTGVGVLTDLAGDIDWCTREAVAAHSTTRPDTLARQANDRSDMVRRRVAQNESTPPGALARLARDEDATVRSFVALNPATPHEALGHLAEDKEWSVRAAVKKNSGPPSPIEKSGTQLFADFQSARKALIAWLEEHFPDNRKIDTDQVHGVILQTYISEDGNPVVELELSSGGLVAINPFNTEVKPHKIKTPHMRPRN